MNQTTILILIIFLTIGLIFTLTVTKIFVKKYQSESENPIFSIILSAMLLIGAIILFNSALQTARYTLDILINQEYDFKNLELYKLLFIYFFVFGISFIVFYFISNYLSRIVYPPKNEILPNSQLIIVGILFIGLCYLSLPFIEIIFNYYKPTVQTTFYR